MAPQKHALALALLYCARMSAAGSYCLWALVRLLEVCSVTRTNVMLFFLVSLLSSKPSHIFFRFQLLIRTNLCLYVFLSATHPTVFPLLSRLLTGCAKLSALSSYFFLNPVEKMIFESIRGRYEKVSFLTFKTKIHKV